MENEIGRASAEETNYETGGASCSSSLLSAIALILCEGSFLRTRVRLPPPFHGHSFSERGLMCVRPLVLSHSALTIALCLGALSVLGR